MHTRSISSPLAELLLAFSAVVVGFLDWLIGGALDILTMLTTTQTTVTRNALADAFDALVNAGANEGGLRLWTGTAADGTELGQFEFADPAFDDGGTGGAGVIQLQSTPIAEVALATGTCQSFDIVQDLAGTPVSLMEGDEGDELTIDNASISSGQNLSLTALTYTQPATE